MRGKLLFMLLFLLGLSLHSLNSFPGLMLTSTSVVSNFVCKKSMKDPSTGDALVRRSQHY